MLDAEDGLRERVAMLATFGCTPMSRFYGHIQIWKMAKLANSLRGHLLCKLATFPVARGTFIPIIRNHLWNFETKCRHDQE
jgi:hypothetical protein